MNESGLGECTSGGTDEYGVWLRFENGIQKYMHVHTPEDIARMIRIYGKDWIEKITKQQADNKTLSL